MANKVLVYLEQRNGNVKKSSYEAAKVGKEFADKLGCEVEAVVIGGEVSNLEKVGGYGIAKVTHLKNGDLELYSSSAYTKLLVEFVNSSGADILISSTTALGKDLAPRVAAKLDAGIAMDCVAFDFGEDVVATRPIYAGKALLDVKVNSPIKVYTIRPNVFDAGQPSSDSASVEVQDIASPDLATKVTEIKKSEGKMDVAEADIIVSGGRGLKDAENFSMIEELAETLGAAVGASRAVVDAGWRPHREQVGQTGKTVTPSLYIAVGISGAIQHLAGMRSSKYIVAINKDKDAPIFGVADYGIAGDAFEVVPKLIEEIKKLKAE